MDAVLMQSRLESINTELTLVEKERVEKVLILFRPEAAEKLRIFVSEETRAFAERQAAKLAMRKARAKR
jgi:hypothetical protein